MHGCFAASFPHLRNNEARAHIAMWANEGPGFIRQFTDTNVYGIGFVKIWKTRHKISVDIRTFQRCTVTDY